MSEPCITIVKKDGTLEVKYVSLRRLPLPWESDVFDEAQGRFLSPEEAAEFWETQSSTTDRAAELLQN
jgi:hypothetical protein